ncbi:hypothetical protein D3C78_1721100 [compost metagenome]
MALVETLDVGLLHLIRLEDPRVCLSNTGEFLQPGPRAAQEHDIPLAAYRTRIQPRSPDTTEQSIKAQTM